MEGHPEAGSGSAGCQNPAPELPCVEQPPGKGWGPEGTGGLGSPA